MAISRYMSCIRTATQEGWARFEQGDAGIGQPCAGALAYTEQGKSKPDGAHRRSSLVHSVEETTVVNTWQTDRCRLDQRHVGARSIDPP